MPFTIGQKVLVLDSLTDTWRPAYVTNVDRKSLITLFTIVRDDDETRGMTQRVTSMFLLEIIGNGYPEGHAWTPLADLLDDGPHMLSCAKRWNVSALCFCDEERSEDDAMTNDFGGFGGGRYL